MSEWGIMQGKYYELTSQYIFMFHVKYMGMAENKAPSGLQKKFSCRASNTFSSRADGHLVRAS